MCWLVAVSLSHANALPPPLPPPQTQNRTSNFASRRVATTRSTPAIPSLVPQVPLPSPTHVLPVPPEPNRTDHSLYPGPSNNWRACQPPRPSRPPRTVRTHTVSPPSAHQRRVIPPGVFRVCVHARAANSRTPRTSLACLVGFVVQSLTSRHGSARHSSPSAEESGGGLAARRPNSSGNSSKGNSVCRVQTMPEPPDQKRRRHSAISNGCVWWGCVVGVTCRLCWYT